MQTQEAINQAKQKLETVSLRWARAMMQGNEEQVDQLEAEIDELLEIVGYPRHKEEK